MTQLRGAARRFRCLLMPSGLLLGLGLLGLLLALAALAGGLAGLLDLGLALRRGVGGLVELGLAALVLQVELDDEEVAGVDGEGDLGAVGLLVGDALDDDLADRHVDV